MTTDFAEYHSELEAVARDVLTTTSPLSSGGQPPGPADWAVLARSGWLGLEVPEALEGSGATFSEVGVVLTQMGAAVTRSPFLGSAVLGTGALNLLEPGDERDSLLQRAGSGETRLAVALVTEPAAADEDLGGFPSAFLLDRSGDRPAIRGEARFVPDAGDADRLLLLATDLGTPVLVVVNADCPGLTRDTVEVTDRTRSVATVRADGAGVEEAEVLRFRGAPEEAAWRLWDRGAVAVACDSLGVAEAMMDATVRYAQVRQQFGRPIGSFQAVKHACADMLVQVNVCRELASAASAGVAAGDPDAWVAAAQAKSHICDVAVAVAGKVMQLHGGIGYTWESGIHFYLKRALFNRSWFGSTAWHRRRLATRYG